MSHNPERPAPTTATPACPTSDNEPSARLYACPGCKSSIAWNSNNPFRPFCSAQCKNQDFVAWANEEHAIAGNPLYDDLLSGDIESPRE